MARKKEFQECLNCVELRKRIKELECQIGSQTLHDEHWKGRDEVIITKVAGGWIYDDHEKDKETRKVTTGRHFVPTEDVEYLLRIYRKEFDEGKTKFKKGYFFDVLIKAKKCPIMRSEFNGSGNRRNTYYFPIYYYPTKIVESMGLIKFGGSGVIEFKDKLIRLFEGGAYG